MYHKKNIYNVYAYYIKKLYWYNESLNNKILNAMQMIRLKQYTL